MDRKDFINYKKQSNIVVRWTDNTKRNTDNLNPCHEPKPFWKTFKPYFSNNSFCEIKNCSYGKMWNHVKRSKVAKTFSSYFALFTKSLDLFYWLCLPGNTTYKIQGTNGSFLNDRSILKIRQNVSSKNFSLNYSLNLFLRQRQKKLSENLASDKATAG